MGKWSGSITMGVDALELGGALVGRIGQSTRSAAPSSASRNISGRFTLLGCWYRTVGGRHIRGGCG